MTHSMKKILRILIVCLLVINFCFICERPAAAADIPSELNLTGQDRILIIAPHPDDETISSGGVIQEAVKLHIPLRILYVTNGDSNQLSFLFYRKQFVF